MSSGMVAAGRKAVVENFSFAARMAKLREIYDSVLNRN
jgi:hypothetical protein